jgi:hypothetical protein
MNNKLTFWLHDSNVVRFRRHRAGEAKFTLKASAPAARSPRGLACIWKADPATGRLYCTWVCDPEQGQKRVRQRDCRAQPLQQLRRAA